MKKFLSIFSLVLLAVFFLGKGIVSAADTLPSNALTVAPANALAGSAITLNALVYNNESVNAVVTVAFTIPDGSTTGGTITIANVTAIIGPASAKTIAANWEMPTQSTVVTATVTAAVDDNKQLLPSLLGTLGTVTVGPSSSSSIAGISFPGSTQISAWFAPLFSTIENWRLQEAVALTTLRTTTQATITSSPSQAFGNPWNYATLIYATIGAALFTNQIIFYIAFGLLVLFVLRMIIRLIF